MILGSSAAFLCFRSELTNQSLCPDHCGQWLSDIYVSLGASSRLSKKESMGVSPINLKKNKCSRHLSPMDRRAGSRSNNLANRPGCSGYVDLQYSSKTAYTFSRSASTCIVDLSPLASGLQRTMARRQPSSVLSILISFILATSSVRTRSKIPMTPAE